MKSTGRRVYLVLILFVLIQHAAFTQKSGIQLTDPSTSEAIIGASWKYGSQSGITDFEGRLHLSANHEDSLRLSHINYGDWYLVPDEVTSAIKNGTIQKLPEFKNIQPATIIAMHPAPGQTKAMELSYTEKLAHDGGAVLAQSPLIGSIKKSGNYGFDPVLRGFKYDQLNIVIDGAQCATAACPNRMDPPTSQVAPNMLARIEILKGPHSLRFGNSFGGTVNFVSPAPRFTENSQGHGRASGSYESNGNIFRTEALVAASTEKYYLGLYGSWSEGANYKDGEGEIVPAGFNRGSAGATLSFKLGVKQQFNVSATRNFAREVIFPALPMDLRTDDTWLLNIRHIAEIGGANLKAWNTNVFGTRVDHFMDNRLKDLDPRMMNAETPARTHSYGGRTEGSWLFGQSRLYAGVDLRIEEAEGKRYREFLMGPMMGNTIIDNAWQHVSIARTALFGEFQIKSGKNSLILSGRLELNEAKVKDAHPEFVDLYGDVESLQINPSISLGGTHSFTSAWNIGLWLGRAQRSAGITERYINSFPVGLDPYEMLGNPDLKQEVNNQADLNLSVVKETLSLSVNFFASVVQNYISSVIDTSLAPTIPSSPGVRQYQNLDNALLTGAEFTYSQKLMAGLQHQFTLVYTYGEHMKVKKPLPEVAPLEIRYTLTGSYLKDKLQPEVALRYAGAQNRISSEFGETASPSFTLVDIKVFYQILPGLRAAAAVNNMFDKAYYEHLSRSVRGDTRAIYSPGRSITVSLTYSF